MDLVCMTLRWRETGLNRCSFASRAFDQGGQKSVEREFDAKDEARPRGGQKSQAMHLFYEKTVELNIPGARNSRIACR